MTRHDHFQNNYTSSFRTTRRGSSVITSGTFTLIVARLVATPKRSLHVLGLLLSMLLSLGFTAETVSIQATDNTATESAADAADIGVAGDANHQRRHPYAREP